jgi:uncharacterized protein (TIGR03067 family)
MTLDIVPLVACILLVAPIGVATFAGDAKDEKLDPTKLVGKWKCVAATISDKKRTADDLKEVTVTITKETITVKDGDVKDGDVTVVMEYKLDTKVKPVVIKFKVTKVEAPGPPNPNSTLKKDARAEGIMKLKGNELWICYDPDGGAAPESFDVKDTKNHVFVLKQAK